jgi:hypothetical protein
VVWTDRNAQFEFINAKAGKFIKAGEPVISVDTKKKENIGNFKNSGSEYRSLFYLCRESIFIRYMFMCRGARKRLLRLIPARLVLSKALLIVLLLTFEAHYIPGCFL